MFLGDHQSFTMAQDNGKNNNISAANSTVEEEKGYDTVPKKERMKMVKGMKEMTENEKFLDLEHQISEMIRNGRSGCHASFRYSHQGSKVRTKLVTWNPKHRSTFLVHEVEARSKVECLNQLKLYVKDKIREKEKPYTVRWYLKDSSNPSLVVSHFYAQDLYTLLDKFYYDKNKEDYEIVEIKLNPST